MYALTSLLSTSTKLSTASVIQSGNEEEISYPETITEYFENRAVFVTGATGFVGKCLVYKLLKSCEGIKSVYVLMRNSKKGLSIQERLDIMLESPLYAELKGNNPEVFKKIIPIMGDINCDKLGISEFDQKVLAENVSVVFHSAATVKFEEPLQIAMNTNVGGTNRVLELSKTMKNLSAVVYISTAYCNSDRNIIEERVYPVTMDPRECLHVVPILHDIGVLKDITPTILARKPNTYTFSKSLAEALVQFEAAHSNLPACIVRPSIVGAAWREPCAGWVDNITAMSGVIYATGHGMSVIHAGNKNTLVDIVPVDQTVNLIIAAAWKTGVQRHKEFTVYNGCTGQFNPLLQRDIQKYGAEGYKLTPFTRMLQYPSTKMSTCSYLNKVYNMAGVGIPAFCIDMLLLLQGRKPTMFKSYQMVQKGAKAVAFFSTTEFDFKSNNVKDLRGRMGEEDSKVFNLNFEGIDWQDYTHKYVHGVRRYFNKDNDSTIPAAKRKLHRFKYFSWIPWLLFGLVVLLPCVIMYILSRAILFIGNSV